MWSIRNSGNFWFQNLNYLKSRYVIFIVMNRDYHVVAAYKNAISTFSNGINSEFKNLLDKHTGSDIVQEIKDK